MIYLGTAVIGRDQFSVRRSSRRRSAGGFTIRSTTFYPADARRPAAISVVEVGADSLPVSVSVETLGDERTVATTTFGQRRISFRTISSSHERLRELPNNFRYLAADPEIPALYTVLPGSSEGEIRIISARDGHVSTSRVVDRGLDIRTIRRSEFQLRHIELSTESGPIHLWYDPEGRLMRVDRPEDGWRAERGS